VADHPVAEDRLAAHNFTLVAATVDTVTFFDAPKAIEVLSDGVDKVYVTTDGSTPTVGGDNTWIIPATPCARSIRMVSGKVVKLLSSGAPTLSVTRI
jgi:hypothetical protein